MLNHRVIFKKYTSVHIILMSKSLTGSSSGQPSRQNYSRDGVTLLDRKVLSSFLSCLHHCLLAPETDAGRTVVTAECAKHSLWLLIPSVGADIEKKLKRKKSFTDSVSILTT